MKIFNRLALTATCFFLLSGCGTKTTTSVAKGVTTTVTQDSQATVVLLTAGTALLSSIMTAVLANWFARATENRKRDGEARDRKEARTRAQIADVATAIGAMIKELKPYLHAYEDGVNDEAIVALEAASQLAAEHAFDSMGKVELLEDETLRSRARGVFEAYELIPAQKADAIANGTEEPSAQGLLAGREAFFARAREVLAGV